MTYTPDSIMPFVRASRWCINDALSTNGSRPAGDAIVVAANSVAARLNNVGALLPQARLAMKPLVTEALIVASRAGDAPMVAHRAQARTELTALVERAEAFLATL